MVRVLELFKGTGSVGKVAKELFPEWEVTSLDILKKFEPTICSDILEWDYKKDYKEGHFDIIWASPECKIFSMLQHMFIGRRWKDAEALAIERQKHWCFPLKVLEIIDYFKPKVYFIENPYYSAMKDIPAMKALKSYRFDYCAFGFCYKKPTRIWTNIDLVSQVCSCEGPHSFNLGTSSKKELTRKKLVRRDPTTINERYSIPDKLLGYLFNEAKKEV